MSEKEDLAVPVVCVVIERISDSGKRQILVQTRWKPEEDPKYLGVIEIPGGKIRRSETVEEAAIREAKEETGLSITLVEESLRMSHVYRHGDNRVSYAFAPLTCTQEIGDHPYIGIFVIARARGDVEPRTREARDHRWISTAELQTLLDANKIFPIFAPGLREYLGRYCDAGGLCGSQ